MPFAGTRDPARLLTAATLVLDRIGYVILQRERIAFAMTTDQPVAAVPVGGE